MTQLWIGICLSLYNPKEIIDFMKNFIRNHPRLFSRTNSLKMCVILIIFSVAIYGSIKLDPLEIQKYIQQNQHQALFISLLIYILFGFTFLPSIPLTLFIAVLIGPIQAAAVAAIGNTVAALFEYQMGKAIGDVVAFDDLKSNLPLGLDKLPIDSPLFMLAARSIPAGARAFSMVCGAYQVPLPIYLSTTSAMYFVSSIFLAYGGIELLKLF